MRCVSLWSLCAIIHSNFHPKNNECPHNQSFTDNHYRTISGILFLIYGRIILLTVSRCQPNSFKKKKFSLIPHSTHHRHDQPPPFFSVFGLGSLSLPFLSFKWIKGKKKKTVLTRVFNSTTMLHPHDTNYYYLEQ